MKKSTIGQRWYEIQKNADDAFLKRFSKETLVEVEVFCGNIYKKFIRELQEVACQNFSETNCEPTPPSQMIAVEIKGNVAQVYYSGTKVGKTVKISNVEDIKTFERLFKIILSRIDEELMLNSWEHEDKRVWEITIKV